MKLHLLFNYNYHSLIINHLLLIFELCFFKTSDNGKKDLNNLKVCISKLTFTEGNIFPRGIKKFFFYNKTRKSKIFPQIHCRRVFVEIFNSACN